ncbi:hypothetical protein OM076_11270 [Solirubrobacter ginsenosidimutans]|uniref:Uncharacterized protein n=1 Tax=Solirubrobacter ginsenosidimutans TaxID=490573 RepID=A0A9X3S245_9ACTN|nr:hypothetical protein [Solirubrobacter ginsenosidimutans]MDA0160846.1 hypothetical protein [Solirubrobacter ginsenosidimutans]
MSELPFLENALRDAARRRRTRRRVVPTVAVLVIALIATATALSFTARDDERVATPPKPWPAVVRHGAVISLPPGWELADKSLTPHLKAPRELFSAATFPLAYRQGRCNHQPDGAARRMTARDAFVTVQEGAAGAPPRPAHFAPSKPNSFESCLADRADVEGYLFQFADAGRSFYAIVWVGTQASKQTKDQTFALLDHLRFRAK